MKRVFILFAISLACAIPCFAGLHFGLGKAAAVKSTEVIEKAKTSAAAIIRTTGESGPGAYYVLTVSTVAANGTSAAGTITSLPAGINCGAGGGVCSAIFPGGCQVVLTASPDPSGSNFLGWSGGGCFGTGNTCPVTLNSNTTISGVFCTTHDQLTYTSPSGNPYTYVVCSNSVTVQAWGGGGRGGNGGKGDSGGGGGGGGYGLQNLNVTPGVNYTVVVGSGGYSNCLNAPLNGGASMFSITGGLTLIQAFGGKGGGMAWGGVGGDGGTSNATTNVPGGNGQNGDVGGSGGGGFGGIGNGGGGSNTGCGGAGADGKVIVTW